MFFFFFRVCACVQVCTFMVVTSRQQSALFIEETKEKQKQRERHCRMRHLMTVKDSQMRDVKKDSKERKRRIQQWSSFQLRRFPFLPPFSLSASDDKKKNVFFHLHRPLCCFSCPRPLNSAALSRSTQVTCYTCFSCLSMFRWCTRNKHKPY